MAVVEATARSSNADHGPIEHLTGKAHRTSKRSPQISRKLPIAIVRKPAIEPLWFIVHSFSSFAELRSSSPRSHGIRGLVGRSGRFNFRGNSYSASTLRPKAESSFLLVSTSVSSVTSVFNWVGCLCALRLRRETLTWRHAAQPGANRSTTPPQVAARRLSSRIHTQSRRSV